NAEPATMIAPAINEEESLVALPTGELALLSQLSSFAPPSVERISFVRDHCFLTFCQLLL
ncbi:MAG: hypothetical protein ABIZ80_17725, partial [Bryobacteraceae bacterium]